jgi:ABC-type lipoprotein export system ATPase subunit
VSCTGLVKIYWTASGEVHALKGIDAVFPSRSVTAVVGPSGSGKSSLLRILAGLDAPTAGSVRIGDRTLGGLNARALRGVRRKLTGYVFQRPADNLIPYLTVRQHMDQARKLRGTKEGPETDELLERLGLGGRADHKPGQLSGGEQQRVAFAQAVVGGPSVVVADEPTSELDSRSGESLLRTVHSLVDLGASFVISTHDPEVVRTADRTLHLRHGALEAESHEMRTLSVIDASGRLQLPPDALELFPNRRAVVEIADGEVRITPP